MFCRKNKYKVMISKKKYETIFGEKHGWYSYKEAKRGEILERWKNEKDEIVLCSRVTQLNSPPNNKKTYDDYEYKGKLLKLIDKLVAPYAVKSTKICEAMVCPERENLKKGKTYEKKKSKLSMRVNNTLEIETEFII